MTLLLFVLFVVLEILLACAGRGREKSRKTWRKNRLLVRAIFLLAFLISWLTNAAQARQVNAELLDFQRRHGGELG